MVGYLFLPLDLCLFGLQSCEQCLPPISTTINRAVPPSFHHHDGQGFSETMSQNKPYFFQVL